MANDIKILMVDDDKMLIDLYKERLELAGYKVEISRDGEEGLTKVHETKPDLVLMDIMMPKVNGYEALASIKSDPSTKDIPVIILSALMRDLNKSKAIEAGADDYIIKSEAMPVDVIKKIESVLVKYKKKTSTVESSGAAQDKEVVEPPKETEPIMVAHTPAATVEPPKTETPPVVAEGQNINFEPATGGQDIQPQETQGTTVPTEGPLESSLPASIPPQASAVPEVPLQNPPQNQNPPVITRAVPQVATNPEQKASPVVVFFLILIVILILASDVYFYLSMMQVG